MFENHSHKGKLADAGNNSLLNSKMDFYKIA